MGRNVHGEDTATCIMANGEEPGSQNTQRPRLEAVQDGEAAHRDEGAILPSRRSLLLEGA